MIRRALLTLSVLLLFSAPASAQVTQAIHHQDHAIAHITKRISELKAERKVHRELRHELKTIAPFEDWLGSTGACESGGTTDLRTGLRAYNPAGPFYARYQFTMSTWSSVGGVGDPRNAGWVEQAWRAVKARWSQGAGAWPVCGH